MTDKHRVGGSVCGARLSRRSLLIAGGLVLAGCAKQERPRIQEHGAAAPGVVSMKTLQPLLERRVQALEQGDERAFLADLDPSNTTMIEQQKLLFANLRQLKLQNFQYIAEKLLHVRQEGDVYHFGPIHEVIQLTADEGPGGVAPASSFRISAVQRDGKLVITDMTGLSGTDADEPGMSGLPAHAPWHLTPLTVKHSDNVCLIGDSSVSDLDRYAAVAGAEAKFVEELWADRLRFPGHVLFLTRDEDNFRTWFGVGESDGRVEGFQFPQYGVRQTGEIYTEQYAGSRMVVNLKRIESFGDDPRLVMRHELAHAVTSRATAPVGRAAWLVQGPPRWAIEGFARWTEGNAEAQRRYAAGRFKGRLPDSNTFYAEADVIYNYAVSSTVFLYIERTKSRAAAVEFYASVIQYHDMKGEALADLPVFNSICKRVLGLSSNEFKQRWANFVRAGA